MINFALIKCITAMRKYLAFVLVLMLQSCYFLPMWEEDVCLAVDNRSSDSLLVYVASGLLPIWPTVYPDTLLPPDSYVGEINLPHINDSISGYLIPVPPHEKNAVLCTEIHTDYWGNGLYDKFFNDFVKAEVLSFFFIYKDSVKKYGYDYVASHNIIAARYDLTASDMKSLGMIIPFPPTESMSDMKTRRNGE